MLVLVVLVAFVVAVVAAVVVSSLYPRCVCVCARVSNPVGLRDYQHALLNHLLNVNRGALHQLLLKAVTGLLEARTGCS